MQETTAKVQFYLKQIGRQTDLDIKRDYSYDVYVTGLGFGFYSRDLFLEEEDGQYELCYSGRMYPIYMTTGEVLEIATQHKPTGVTTINLYFDNDKIYFKDSTPYNRLFSTVDVFFHPETDTIYKNLHPNIQNNSTEYKSNKQDDPLFNDQTVEEENILLENRETKQRELKPEKLIEEKIEDDELIPLKKIQTR